jgi:hypothetical protein
MSMLSSARPRRRLARIATAGVLAAISLAALSPAGAGAQPAVGIADQSADTFADPLFTGLGVKHARLNLAWDVFEHPWQVEQLDAWMAAASAAGVQPLVIFSQSRVEGRTRVLPSVEEYRQAVLKLRARHPFVNELAAWNEMNYPGQPTFARPGMVARYYGVLRATCPSCRVLPGSLLDNPNLVPWTRRLRAEIRRLGQPDPRLWGLHNYSDVNRLRDAATRRLLATVRGKVWLTETGGVVRATSPTASKYRQGPDFAGRVTGYLLGNLVRRNPRVARVYLYEWKAPTGSVSWDSGLVAPDGSPRPAYRVVEKYLRGGMGAGKARPKPDRARSENKRGTKPKPRR